MNRIKGETGFQNAERFVRFIEDESKENRYVIAYERPGRTDNFGWSWMSNKDWRVRVHRELEDKGLVWNPSFAKPDLVDGWSFFGTSKFPKPKAEMLTIDDTLDPPLNVSRVPRPILVGVWLAVLCAAVLVGVQSCRHAARADSLPQPLTEEASR